MACCRSQSTLSADMSFPANMSLPAVSLPAPPNSIEAVISYYIEAVMSRHSILSFVDSIE